MADIDADCARYIDAAMVGDPAALEALLALVRPHVVRYCRGRIGAGAQGPATADDVAQEALLALLTALPRYRATGAGFLAFAFGIAKRKIADHYRGRQADRERPIELEVETADTAAGPEQRAVDGDLARRVGSVLDELAPDLREILTLRVVLGMTAGETAAAVSSTPVAVRVAQHRALNKLRKRLRTACCG